MSQQPQSREELYERIRESSRDEVILVEMIRLGFWPEAGQLPEDPAEEIRRRTQLEAELRALRTEQSRLHDIEAMKREARKRRLAESRERRKQTKARRLQERAERAQRWAEIQAQSIGYLGKGVSAGLNNIESDKARLAALNLPELDGPSALAQAMGCSISKLRFLAFTRSSSRVSHYTQFRVAKRSGGHRLISAPLPQLKDAQSWILQHILDLVPTHDAAHGFVPGRSIVSNAAPHVGQKTVVNLDLKDFFPTITYKRVKGVFRGLGYSESVAIVLTLLCTEPQTRAVELDGVDYHVASEQRVLPQGAPTSPAISNLICRGLDNRVLRVSEKLGFRYTRYADDLSFSGPKDANVGQLLRRIEHIIKDEGFVVHPDKTRILRQGRRQEVTGIVVNDQLNVSRSELRRFRATLFQIEKDGPEGKSWGQFSGRSAGGTAGDGHDVIAAVEGFANYVAMVNPEKGAPLQARAKALVERYGKRPQRKPAHKPSGLRDADAHKASQEASHNRGRTAANDPTTAGDATQPGSAEHAPDKPWWKFW